MFIALAPPTAAVSTPVWLEQPPPAELAMARAKRSSSDELDGFLQMNCYVQADGRLALCTGDPALVSLAQRYRVDRAAYPAPKVNVAYAIEKLYDRRGTLDRGPTKADLKTLGGSGVVTLLCPVSETGATGDCEVEDGPGGSTPPAADDIAAARKAAALYHYKPATLKGRPQPFYTSLTIALGDPDLIRRPNWLKKPSSEEVSNAYPAAAALRGVGGKVLIECKIARDGVPYDCRIISESPSGVGFGDATLKLASKFRMQPEVRNGAVFDGGIVRIPITFSSGGPTTGLAGSASPALGAFHTGADL